MQRKTKRNKVEKDLKFLPSSRRGGGNLVDNLSGKTATQWIQERFPTLAGSGLSGKLLDSFICDSSTGTILLNELSLHEGF